MKISLISPYPDITAFGIRTISAYLKQHGHETQVMFLPDPYGDNLKFLAKEGAVKAISRANPFFLCQIGYNVGEIIRFIFKGIKVISCGDWERLRLYINRIREKDRLTEGRKG